MTDAARPPEYDLAFAILAAVADPVESKARLDKMLAAEKTIRELTDTLNEARAEHEKARTAALSAQAAAKAQQEALDKRAAMVDQQEANLRSAQSVHTQNTAALAAKVNQTNAHHADRAAALQKRDENLTAAEKDFAKRTSALEAKEADYQRRMAKFKELAA